MRFTDSFLDEIRARLSVSEVVGRRVSWDRRKSAPLRGDFWACCPFHHEKTASFHADDRRGRYYCFGCRASGDIFRFLVEKEGISFPEAVERLAQEAGIALPKPSPEEQARETRRTSLYQAMELAAKFYEARLQAAEGAHARGYLARRGVSDAMQRQFRLGYAPAGRHVLKSFLAEQGVDGEAMAEAGLVIAGADIPVPFDRFRERVMFPIRDGRGRVVAFGGRALAAEVQAKYLNSPETPLFRKGQLLYNLDQARGAAHEQRSVIAVEGYMDVIALAAAGLAHAVAPLGTALTEEQLQLLWRLAPEPTLCFDGDAAGLKAAARAVDLALPVLQPGQSVRFALLPEDQDPDDLVRSGGRDAMDQVLAAAEPLVGMLWRREIQASDLTTPERRAALEGRLEAAVRRIGDARVQQHYRAEIKARLDRLWNRDRASGRVGGRGFPWRIRGGGKGTPGDRFRTMAPVWSVPLPASSELKADAERAAGRRIGERREQLILAALLNHPYLANEEAETLAGLELEAGALDRLKGDILEVAALETSLDRTLLRDHLTRRGHLATLGRIEARLKQSGEWFVRPDAAREDVLVGFRHMVALHRKSVTLSRELRAAEQAFAANPTEEEWVHLHAVLEELRSSLGEEAHIDGFGTASGRSAAALG